MDSITNLIFTHPANRKVLEYLGIKPNFRITSVQDKEPYTHEGLEDFLELDLPSDSKYIVGSNGMIVIPETGEIIAFQFGRSEVALKVTDPGSYNNNFKHIRSGLLENWKLLSSLKVSLRYFSNIYGDANTVIDIRELGKPWALSIYFVGEAHEHIKEYYTRKRKT